MVDCPWFTKGSTVYEGIFPSLIRIASLNQIQLIGFTLTTFSTSIKADGVATLELVDYFTNVYKLKLLNQLAGLLQIGDISKSTN